MVSHYHHIVPLKLQICFRKYDKAILHLYSLFWLSIKKLKQCIEANSNILAKNLANRMKRNERHSIVPILKSIACTASIKCCCDDFYVKETQCAPNANTEGSWRCEGGKQDLNSYAPFPYSVSNMAGSKGESV